MEFIDESPAPEQISTDAREHMKEQRQEQKNPGKKGARAMTMVSLGPGQIRPIGSWVNMPTRFCKRTRPFSSTRV